MKKLLLLLSLIPVYGYCEGPLYRHKEAPLQLEFDNVYQDLRKAQSAVSASTAVTPGVTYYAQINPSAKQEGAINVEGVTTSTLTVSSFTITTGRIASPSFQRSIIGGTNRFEVGTTSAVVTVPIRNTGQPSFSSYLNGNISAFVGSNVTARTMPFNAELYDQDSGMGTSTYTVTTAGRYTFNATAVYNCATSHDSGEATISIVTTNATFRDICTIGSVSVGTNFSCSVSGSGNMNAGDEAYVTLQVYGVGGAGTRDCSLTGISGSTVFSRFAGRLAD